MAFSTFDILIALDVQSRGGGVLGALQRDLASTITGVRNLGAAFSDTTRLAQEAAGAQNALSAASLRLQQAQKTQAALSAGGFGVAARDVQEYTAALAEQRAAAEASTLAQQRLAASMAGPGAALARVGEAAGPLVATTAVLALGAALQHAVSDANAFNEALSKVQANTGEAAQSMARISQAALDLGASGTTPYTATQLAAGTLVPLSHQIPAQTVARALPLYSQLSAVLREPDTTTAASAIGALQASFGAGGAKGATVASLRNFANMVAAAEQFGGLTNPGQIAATVGRFAGPSALAGVRAPEALTFVAAQTYGGLSALRATQNLTTLESALLVKPTATTQRLAAALGIAVGPGAQEQYGGFFPYLQAIYQRTVGVSPRLGGMVLAQLLGQRNATSGLELVQRTVGLADLQAQAQRTATAEGRHVLQTAYDATQRSPTQQWKDTLSRLDTDLTTVGTTLTKQTQPALLAFTNATLLYAEAVGEAALKVGGSAGGIVENITKSAPWGALMGNNPFAQFLHTIMTPDWIGAIAKLSAPAWQGATSASGVRAAISGPQFPSAFPVDARTFIAPTRQPVGPLRTAPPNAAPGITALRALRAGPSAPAARTPVPVLTVPTAPSAFVIPTVRVPLGPVETPALRAARERDARLQSAAALLPGAARTRTTRPRTGLTGPELIRRTPGGMFDPQAIFASQGAAWGASVVQLAGGRANPQAEQIHLLQQQLRQSEQQNGFLRELVRQLQLGNVLSRQQVAELDRLGALPGGTSTNVPRPTVAAPRSHVAAVR
jgi:hypothetical protein